MESQKHILFYSSFCLHCTNTVSEILKRDIRHFFILINVEKRQVPDFVDRVPFVITNEKQIVTDEGIIELLDKITMVKVDTSVIPFSQQSSKGNFGNNFSYIDDDVNKPPQDINSVQNFVFLTDDSSSIQDSMIKEGDGKKDKLSDAQYEEFMKKRSTEIGDIPRKII